LLSEKESFKAGFEGGERIRMFYGRVPEAGSRVAEGHPMVDKQAGGWMSWTEEDLRVLLGMLG